MNPSNQPLTIDFLAGEYTIHRLDPEDELPDLTALAGFCALVRTGEATTLVCGAVNAIAAGESSAGWSAFRVRERLDFSLTGVLAGISHALAEAGVSIFAISCWETDYVLVRAAQRELACRTLEAAGYRVLAAVTCP